MSIPADGEKDLLAYSHNDLSFDVTEAFRCVTLRPNASMARAGRTERVNWFSLRDVAVVDLLRGRYQYLRIH